MYFEKLGQCYPWVQGIFCVPVSYNGHPLEHPLCDIMTLWGPNWPGRGASSFVPDTTSLVPHVCLQCSNK